ncbi:MAG: TetR/AcrR family transcriptional regulator [Pedobacter sp.]|nr:MAG: TetR/AcrR family transcriptional regulator [Pedobacter sp.]
MNKRKEANVKKSTRSSLPRPKQSRNIEATKQLFLAAIGEMILENGISSLRVNQVAKRAGRNKGLLYQYFHSLEGLLKEYLELNDDFLVYEQKIDQVMEGHRADQGRELASLILKNHFQNFMSNKLLRQISLLELTERSDLLVELSNSRERLGDKLFSLSEDYFRNTGVSIRVIEAILIAGINYIVLHSETNSVNFCGIDIKNDDHRNLIRKTLHQITEWAYEHAEAVKSGKKAI